MKRILLFIITNLAVVFLMTAMFHVLCALLGVDPAGVLSGSELNIGALAVYALVFGMTGSVVSLLLSKTIAKMSVGARTIDGSEGEEERWIVETVRRLAERANINMPEVAVYHGSPNAFATGAFRNHALVAVSDGLMGSMTHREVEAVLGHELSHVSNGDMVTTTLLQGILNACVLFVARVAAWMVANALAGGRGNRRGASNYFVYHIVSMVAQILLGLAASLVVFWHSRRREYAADAGSATLLGTPMPMIEALRRLGGISGEPLPDSLKALGIDGKRASLFATHPSIEDRIAALESFRA